MPHPAQKNLREVNDFCTFRHGLRHPYYAGGKKQCVQLNENTKIDLRVFSLEEN